MEGTRKISEYVRSTKLMNKTLGRQKRTIPKVLSIFRLYNARSADEFFFAQVRIILLYQFFSVYLYPFHQTQLEPIVLLYFCWLRENVQKQHEILKMYYLFF